MWAAVLLAVACAALAASAEARSLPVLSVTASDPTEFGRAIGVEFAAQIRVVLATDPYLTQVVQPWAATAAGQHAVAAMMAYQQQLYPDYVAELQGMAAGAGVDSTLLFLENMEDDLSAWLAAPDAADTTSTAARTSRRTRRAGKCTDVLFWNSLDPSTGGVAIGHNEDDDPFWLSLNYVVNATLSYPSMAGGTVRFVAYTYAAQLPGNAFGWSGSAQVAVTCNSLFPTAVDNTTTGTAGGAGQYFVARDVLNAVDFDDALRRAQALDTTNALYSGISINLVSLFGTHALNVESCDTAFAVTPRFADSERHSGAPQLAPAFGQAFHMNNYLYLSANTTGAAPDPSSSARLARATELLAQYNATTPGVTLATSLAGILGDAQGQYPLFRTGGSVDPVFTLATVLYDLTAMAATVYLDNPKTSKPALTLSLL